MKKMIRVSIISSMALFLVMLLSSHKKDEGMFPLNYLDETALQQAGMKLTAKQIFNPGEVALANALVKLGGCTGSFISDQGLIITNHHCVYGGVASLSNKEHNYLENGFVAKDHAAELTIDMPCRITQSYEDVSSRVLFGIADNMDPTERALKIGENIKHVVKTEKEKTPDLSVEISEMFTGKSYTLFRYLLITDVRLVFAPPVTIGQFGGDQDNWEWPRHNGDFSIVRAYVGKDGKPAKFNKDNVPYKPARHLKINAKGTKENDFVFILGYPGRTFRHETAPYMQFQQDFQLPETQKFYKFLIDQMREKSKGDENKYLAFAGNIQSLENVEKNYRGKMQGLMRTNLAMRKAEDEDAMQKLTETTPSLQKYKDVIPKLKDLWLRKLGLAPLRYNYNWFVNESNPFYAAQVICSSKSALDTMKNKALKKQVYSQLQKSLAANYSIVDKAYEKAVVVEMLSRLSALNPKIKVFLGKLSSTQWVEKNSMGEKLYDSSWVNKNARTHPEVLVEYKSQLTGLYKLISEDVRAKEIEWQAIDNEIKSIMPKYLEIKQQLKTSQFIPDANSTLRLTYGYIKRYSPNDAEINLPFTTLRGVFEKANTSPDYRLPQIQADNLRVKDVPAFFKDPETGEVIVCFLYNLDTTGGNSGSPVLDANGDLIGVNFDRSFSATINDYAWNDKYSRSIGCDIRYVLYVMKYVGKADHVIKELGLNL